MIYESFGAMVEGYLGEHWVCGNVRSIQHGYERNPALCLPGGTGGGMRVLTHKVRLASGEEAQWVDFTVNSIGRVIEALPEDYPEAKWLKPWHDRCATLVRDPVMWRDTEENILFIWPGIRGSMMHPEVYVDACALTGCNVRAWMDVSSCAAFHHAIGAHVLLTYYAHSQVLPSLHIRENACVDPEDTETLLEEIRRGKELQERYARMMTSEEE